MSPTTDPWFVALSPIKKKVRPGPTMARPPTEGIDSLVVVLDPVVLVQTTNAAGIWLENSRRISILQLNLSR